MSPTVSLRLPDGRVVVLGPDALVGRSSAATARIDDARVSTIHAELSYRAAGPTLLARGGRLRVGGRAVREILLTPGLAIDLAPGVAVEVVAVAGGASEVVPPTAGRERLRIRLQGGEVHVLRGADADPAAVLTGVSARIVEALIERPDGARWGDVAEAVWPEEGRLRARLREAGRAGADDWTEVDERRFRNRWDQALRVARLALAPLRGGALLESEGGALRLRLAQGDLVEVAADHQAGRNEIS